MKWRSSLFLILLFISCGRTYTGGNDEDHSLDDLYRNDLRLFRNALDNFALETGSGEDLHTAFRELRKAFKRIEFFLEYSDGERHQLFNGAPVLTEDRSGPGYGVIAPQGLQVIGQLLCTETTTKEEIEKLVAELKYQALLYETWFNAGNYDTGQYIKAIQLHLVRIESLTLAGFENHCGENTAVEVSQALDAIYTYLAGITDGSDDMAARQVELLREVFYNTNNLEEIDLTFIIRNHLQPLRRSLAKLSTTGSNPARLPIDLQAVSLYDKNFINASFFSPYGMEENTVGPKADLGRKLFQDPILSKTGTMSCATCHRPSNFFADGLVLSASADSAILQRRNTPTLIHSAYQGQLMYDGRAASLEDQMLHVFRNRLEFQTHLSEAIEKLNNDELYFAAFSSLYPEMGENPVNLHSLTDAVAVYLRSLTGHNSPFDQYMRGEEVEIDRAALKGFNLFMKKGKCGTCHFSPTFSGLLPPFYVDSEFENIGVPMLADDQSWVVDTDLGRWNFYNHDAFRHFFKTSTVRNSEMTGPYMHNGVLATLEEVLDFYNNGGGVGSGLHYANQSLPADSLRLNEEEQRQIISFLRSLTDPDHLYTR